MLTGLSRHCEIARCPGDTRRSGTLTANNIVHVDGKASISHTRCRAGPGQALESTTRGEGSGMLSRMHPLASPHRAAMPLGGKPALPLRFCLIL